MSAALARRYKLGLLLVVLLAFGLRLYAIDRQNIWGDEAFSIWLSEQPLPDVVAGGADTHPPLYPFLLFVWLRLAGSTPLAVRFLSALIGTLTVPPVYLLGRRAFGRAAGGLAALLAAVSPVLVYYSQETRMYGLVTLLAALSVYWTLRILDDRLAPPAHVTASHALSAAEGAAKNLPGLPILAYLAFTLGAVYTHYYAFFVVLAENLAVLPTLIRRRRWPALRRWLAMQAAIAVAYVPWIVVQSRFLGGKAGARFGEWDLGTALRIVGQAVTAFGAGLAVPPVRGWIIAALFLIAVAAGTVVLLRRRAPASWLVGAYLAVPLFLAWAVNPIMPFFYARYLLLIVPAFYLLAAGGVAAWRKTWRPVGAGVLVVASCVGLLGYYTDDAYLKGRYGDMMAYVQEHAHPGDALILANQLQRPIFEYYRPAGVDTYFFPSYNYALEDPRTAAELEAIASDHRRVWVVRFGNPAEYDPDGYLTRWLATHGSKGYASGWVDADLSMYLMARASAGATIKHRLDVLLGGQVGLLGYTLSTREVAPGDVLLLTLYWDANNGIAQRYTVFTHLLDAHNVIQAQMDSEPQGGALPTDRWLPGQIVEDNYALTVSMDAQPGTHILEVGMYLLSTMQRLPALDVGTGTELGDRVVLCTVQVVSR
jgi:mannosyltransferase